jgi:hypothetical protein
VRLRIEESPAFRQASRNASHSLLVPAIEAIRTHPRPILAVLFAEMALRLVYETKDKPLSG